MDGIGLDQVLTLFSKACRGEAFTKEEITAGNFPREHIVPLLDLSWKPGPELMHNIVKVDPEQSGPGSAPCIMPEGAASWSHFDFQHSALTRLKDIATSTLPSATNYISADDALTAFIWQSITRARMAQFDGTTKTSFARAVDVRRYLDIPQKYPGFIQTMTYHDQTMQEMTSSPLGPIYESDGRLGV